MGINVAVTNPRWSVCVFTQPRPQDAHVNARSKCAFVPPAELWGGGGGGVSLLLIVFMCVLNSGGLEGWRRRGGGGGAE